MMTSNETGPRVCAATVRANTSKLASTVLNKSLASLRTWILLDWVCELAVPCVFALRILCRLEEYQTQRTAKPAKDALLQLFVHAQQPHCANCHRLASRSQVVDLTILIRLMRHLQNPRPVRDALFDPGNPSEVLLIISAWTRDQRRFTADRFANDAAHRSHQRRIGSGHRRMNDQQVLHLVLKIGIVDSQLLNQLYEFQAHFV